MTLVALAVLSCAILQPANSAPRMETRSRLRARSTLDIRIDGPTHVAAGQLVKLEATGPDGAAFAWHLAGEPQPSDLWDVPPNNGGRIIYFANKEARAYTFILSAAVAGEDGQPPTIEVFEHVLTVDPDQPTTPTTPPTTPTTPPTTPPTNPPTTPPAGPTYGLATFARDAAGSVAPANRARVAAALSVAYTTVAGKIAAGELASVTEITTMQGLVNTSILTSEKAGTAWNGFFQKLSDRLTQLGLPGLPFEEMCRNYAAAWREIAAGLDQVK